MAFGSHAGHATLPEPELPADAMTSTFFEVAYAIALFSADDSELPPRLRFIATMLGWSAAARIALTIADVGQPLAPHTRCTYTFTCGAAPVTPTTPTVLPAIVPVVCVPCPSSGVSLGSFFGSVLSQSRPAISRPVNSGW